MQADEDHARIGSDKEPNLPPGSGRKSASESRSEEIRAALLAWKHIPESKRPSLRALARELRTSHQLLTHYLTGLEKWRQKERYQNAKNRSEEIRARATAENRALFPWEVEQIRACSRATMHALIDSAMFDKIDSIKREAERGPLNWHHIEMLKIFARNGFPGAQELLQKYSQTDPPKPRKLELSAKQRHLLKTLPKAAARRYKRWLEAGL